MNEILNTHQVSAMTGVPVETLRWRRYMSLPPQSFKLSPRAVRYDRAIVEAWVEDARQGGAV